VVGERAEGERWALQFLGSGPIFFFLLLRPDLWWNGSTGLLVNWWSGYTGPVDWLHRFGVRSKTGGVVPPVRFFLRRYAALTTASSVPAVVGVQGCRCVRGGAVPSAQRAPH
jgi:hypothetical protein